MTNAVLKIILEKSQCLCRLAVEVRQFAKKLFRFFVFFNGGGHFWVTWGHGGGVGVEVHPKKSFRGRFEINASTCQGKKGAN